MKRINIFLLSLTTLLLCATPLHAQEPYAVLSADNTVLTFYYDEDMEARHGMSVGPFEESSDRGWNKQCATITTVVFDNSFADCTTITSTSYWFAACFSLGTISGIENLMTENVMNMNWMFDGCSGLTSLDLSGFKTDNVMGMSCMFQGCSGLTSLDLSSFKTDNVRFMLGMFLGCSGLTAIYVGDGWNTEKVMYGLFMFRDCTKLVGGKGTAYDEAHTDYTYAHIDGGASNPGYFTDINDSPGDLSCDVDGDGKVTAADVVALARMIAAGSNDAAADVNGDGVVSIADLVRLLNLLAAPAK